MAPGPRYRTRHYRHYNGVLSEHLWAPWRLSYIKGAKEEGCIFCTRIQRSSDQEDLILHRGESAFVILNAFPYSNGHLMIVPNLHTDALELLPEATMADMSRLLQRSVRALKAALSPGGFNIGFNIGRCAGAGVPGHVHQHVVPRWDGDTNFMPVLADTAVMPELLQQTWQALKAAF
ncbi:MAG TPA: HIT domain-containing protein [Chloroflexota bacterium]|nr:HIT domain-containing protein [Chloroflexota bacterium]